MTLSDLAQANLAYLGSPYTLHPVSLDRAFKEIACIGGRLIKKGVRLFCPISHTHPMAMFGGVDPKNHAIWLPLNEPFLALCDVLIVAEMASWRDSYGLRMEIDCFHRAQKPVVYLDPPTLHLSDHPHPQKRPFA